MIPNFRGFRVDPVAPDQAATAGAARILAWSDQPFGSNAFVRAWVGAQELTQITVDQFGMSFTGFVAAMPAAGDTLAVQIDGEEKIETGLTADDDPPVV